VSANKQRFTFKQGIRRFVKKNVSGEKRC